MKINPTQIDLLGATLVWGGGQKGPLPKICHTYPTMMELVNEDPKDI